MRWLQKAGCVMVAMVACSSVVFAKEEAVRRFYVSDYGAVASSGTDAGPGIRQAISEAVKSASRAEIVLDEGEYRIAPMGGSKRCISLDGASNITITGKRNKTRVVVTDPHGEFFIASNCRNVLLKDITVDYDPLPFTQGTIVAVDAAGGTFDLNVDEAFPLLSESYFNVASKWGVIINNKERLLKAGASDHVFISSFAHISDRTWRFTLQADQLDKLHQMAVGDRYVQMARQGFTTLGFIGCRDCRVENVTVHASGALACALIGNEGKITLHNYAVRFKPGSNRLLTTNGDGVHCQRNRVGPTIENCYFEGMADDSINIYSPPYIIEEVKSQSELICSASGDIRPGDLLQILDSQSGSIRGEAKAVDVKMRDAKYQLTMDRPIGNIKAGKDHRDSDTLYNLSACGTGFVIRNNTMRNHRRHGVLLRAGDGLVEGNVIDNVAGLGIVLTNEPGWPEGPIPWNVVIRNNVINGCGYSCGYADTPQGASIQVRGIGLNGQLSADRAVHSIVISGNKINSPAGAAIYMGAVRGATISKNAISASENDPSYRRCASVIVDNCAGVVVKGNNIRDTRAQTTAAMHITRSSAGGKSGVDIQSCESRVAAGSVSIIDDRTPE